MANLFPDALIREMDVLPRGLSRPSAEARHRDRIPDRRLTDLRHENRPYVFPHYATRAQWLARAEELRRQVLVSAGLCPMPERSELKPVVTRSAQRDDYVIENVCFETLPGFYVTGNLYRPAGARGRVPGIANPHGQWKEGRFGDGFGNPIATRCIHFAKQGCAAFSYDMVGYGDRQAASHQYRSLRGDLWGITLLGLQLWNSIRVLDYLASLPCVDPERLGCTGASGGGAVWERVAAWLGEGREVFFVDPYLTGEYHDPARRVGRAEDLKFFTTYNRTDAALRAQDLVTACAYARGVTGAAGVDLWARGDAGPWALLARPFVPGLGRTVIEGERYALEDDDYILERCYVPGLRRLGGFRTAAVLAAPAPLQMTGAGEEFSAFLRRLYGMMGAEGEVAARQAL